jgi:hypothetical protein
MNSKNLEDSGLANRLDFVADLCELLRDGKDPSARLQAEFVSLRWNFFSEIESWQLLGQISGLLRHKHAPASQGFPTAESMPGTFKILSAC